VDIIKKTVLPIIVFLTVFTAIFYRLFDSFNFHPDFARDVYDLTALVSGKLTLIGPKLSFGGIYSGPYYYYILAPVFFISRLDIHWLLIFNFLLFMAGGLFFYLPIVKRNGVLRSVVAVSLVLLLPIMVRGARGPWNGSTYLPLLLIFFSLVYFFDFNNKKIMTVLLGFFSGVIMNIHLAATPVVLAGLIYLLSNLKNKKEFFWVLLGIVAAFMPLIFFEIRHGFVMIKNTFLVGSYRSFIENNNIANAVSGKKNVIENLFFLSARLSEQLGINVAFYMIALSLFLFKTKTDRTKYLVLSFFLLIVFFAVVLRYQFGSHYLFPLSLFLVFVFIVSAFRTKYDWLVLIFLILTVFSFPKDIYNRSTRKAETYENRVKDVISRNLVNKHEAFNIIQVSKDYGVYIPVGHEYRFFFRKNGYIPKTEFEYAVSDKLLVFSEIKGFDIKNLDNWEAKEFGKNNFSSYVKYRLDKADLYLIKKQ